MRVLVIQHDHISSPGLVGERFQQRGWDVEAHLIVGENDFHAPGVQTELPDATRFDAVIAMGAPWSTYDHELIGSWVLPETELLRAADYAGVPVLGICFGGQLLASAHGGTVQTSVHPEVGWSEVDSDDETVVPAGAWFQWHYDCWTMPPGADEVAWNLAGSQAFVLRRNLAVQFHPELTTDILLGWLANGGTEQADAFGHDPIELVNRTRSLEPDARERAHRLVDAFLDRVATRPHPRDPAGAGDARLGPFDA